MFKVGDRVKYTGKHYLGHDWLVGKEGIIVQLETDTNINVDFKGQKQNKNGYMGCYPENLVKIRSVENTLQIGDRVRAYDGNVGTIIMYHDNGDQDTLSVSFDYESIDHLNGKTYHFSSLKKEVVHTYNIGDKVLMPSGVIVDIIDKNGDDYKVSRDGVVYSLWFNGSYFMRKVEDMEKFTVKLSNGLEVTGTLDQIQKVASGFGISVGNDGVHYLSASRGLIRIDSMDKTHVRNAMLKYYRTWVESLSTLNGSDLVNALKRGPSDKTFIALLARYIDLV